MTGIAFPRHTVRERIMSNIEGRFRDAQEGENGRSVTWDRVTRRPIMTREASANEHVVGIFDPKEKKSYETGVTLCSLIVRIEFLFKPMLGDIPETYMEDLLGEVQSIVFEDPTHGGLALDTAEIDNELDLEGDITKSVAGIVTFGVTYRHKVNDPFSTIGE